MSLRAGDKEAVFSSSEDRIRDGRAAAGIIGSSVVQREARTGLAAVWIRRAAESFFSVLFPSDYCICCLPLLNLSPLSACPAVHRHRTTPGTIRRCPVCRRTKRPLERAGAYGSCDRGPRELVHLRKYNRARPAANVLGRLPAGSLKSLEPSFSEARILVVPVPLHHGQRKQRGLNQAGQIAQPALHMISAKQRLQLARGVLRRTTHSRIGLTSHPRCANRRGAFSVPRAREVTGREVVFVDDAYTTGSTVSECARILGRAGASQVWVATLARTLQLASKYEETDRVGTTPEAGSNGSKSQGFKDHAESVKVENFETWRR